MERIPVARPNMSGNERKYVNDCLDSSWISSAGYYIEKFESEFAKYVGTKYAISTNNGTTALHLALIALGVKPGDEVLIPTVTYIATANAVKYCGATPVLCESNGMDFNICVDDLKRKVNSKTKGIIAVHLYGHPANMLEINKVAKDNGLWVVEDAAEAHGAKVNGVSVGALGDCATFSFFGNKIITTGEGGMVTTNNKDLADKMRIFRGQGMDPHRRYWFPVIGYNYRMTNIQAAIGLAQLETIDASIAKRERIRSWYDENLNQLSNFVEKPSSSEWADPVCWMYTIKLKGVTAEKRDFIMGHMDKLGVETRPVFYPMHMLPPYLENTSYPIAEKTSSAGINLPTFEDMTEEQVIMVCMALSEAIELA